MAKRNAASELNHDNWDQEDESEEAGEFKGATDDQMKVDKCYCCTMKYLFTLVLAGSCHKKG